MTDSSVVSSNPPVSPAVFSSEFLEELRYAQGVDFASATTHDYYEALARTVRRHLVDRWSESVQHALEGHRKIVAYFSAEYLLGRQLGNALLATGLEPIARDALKSLGLDFDEIAGQELEPGLGNGGLGRLAACFLDSMATKSVPAVGYGIRYEYGIFRQTFEAGEQVEKPDYWLELGNPWELPRPEDAQIIGFEGHVESWTDDKGRERRRWVPGYHVRAVPYNYLVPGYATRTVDTLRLWAAKATRAFDLKIFNAGDYEAAVRAQVLSENISKVLYPEDSTPQGKELRLQQQYFFCAASLHDLLSRLYGDDPSADLSDLPSKVAIQLNDTHPVIGIPELMRILVDERGYDWDAAWEITRHTFNYTCHTLLPEALEIWDASVLGKLLPRHLEIIYKINDTFLAEVQSRDGVDLVAQQALSIIQEQPQPAVRMAYLATVASEHVNGVAELHSQLLRDKVLKDFSQLWPEKFANVTNGVTPRRFVRLANPTLSNLITEAIGPGWLTDLDRLERLVPLADDDAFLERFVEVKRQNKRDLADYLGRRDGAQIDPSSMFDAMVKRLHEYKRQVLKVLHVVTVYDQVLQGKLDIESIPARTVLFGAKAAPGYRMAKQIIHLMNAVADVVNAAPELRGRLRVVYPPNYNVTIAERLIPAADLSEQISLAGKEASGTGNMKFALNGALTIGTLDGANVEIRERVGDDHFFLFGMTEPEVEKLAEEGYHPDAYYEQDPRLHSALDLIGSGAFSGGSREVFAGIIEDLLVSDRFMVLADYASYIDEQSVVDRAYADEKAWARSAVLNVAQSGFFSSDRAIQDYLDRIWEPRPARG